MVNESGEPGWGRPSKLTPEVQALISNFVSDGNSLEVAAAVAGVHRSTAYEWQRRGRAARERLEIGETIDPADERFVEFVDAVDQARADAEARAVQVVVAAVVRHDLKAAQWFLERAHPERWARRAPDPPPQPPRPALDGFERDASVRLLAEQLKALSPTQRAQLVWDATVAAITDVDVARELEHGRDLRTEAESRQAQPIVEDESGDEGEGE